MLTNDLIMCYFVELSFRGYLKQLEEDRAISKTNENKFKEKDYLKDYITADSFTE